MDTEVENVLLSRGRHNTCSILIVRREGEGSIYHHDCLRLTCFCPVSSAASGRAALFSAWVGAFCDWVLVVFVCVLLSFLARGAKHFR